LAGLAVRRAGLLPWSALRRIYTRIGAAEGISPRRLGDVDLAAVADSFAERYPKRRYPAMLLGSSNGALTHLAAAMQVPWLPDTVLVPVARVGDLDRPDHAMDFGRSVASALLDRNPDIVLHHMHDQLQDALMAERMSYFRVKWRRLPAAYAAFVDNNLAANGTVVVLHDHSAWPVTRIGPRHVFQAGGRGGTPPEGYLARPHTPAPNDEAAESEWGLDAISAMTCEPGALSAAIAMQRSATTDRKPQPQRWRRSCAAGIALEASQQLVWSFRVSFSATRGKPSALLRFRIGSTFAVQPALQALDNYLDNAEPYRDVNVFLFEHGAESAGIAKPVDFAHVIRRHGATAHFDGLDPRRFPHDIGTLGRYGRVFDQLPRAKQPWSPMTVEDALRGLAAAGISISPAP
jgi:hypothetical protein